MCIHVDTCTCTYRWYRVASIHVHVHVYHDGMGTEVAGVCCYDALMYVQEL